MSELQYSATAICSTVLREKGPATVLGIAGTDEARVSCSVLDKSLMIRSMEELLQTLEDLGHFWEGQLPYDKDPA